MRWRRANKRTFPFFFNVRLLSATTSSWWIYADVLADFSSSLYCLSRRPFRWLEPRGSTADAPIKVLSAEHFRHVSYQRDCAKPCSLFLGLRRTFLRLFVSLFSLAFNRRVTWIFRPFSILALGQIFLANRFGQVSDIGLAGRCQRMAIRLAIPSIKIQLAPKGQSALYDAVERTRAPILKCVAVAFHL